MKWPLSWSMFYLGHCIHVIMAPDLLNSLRPSDTYMHRYTNHHWFRQWLVAWSAPSHFLNQCWDIVNWTLRNKLQWNFNRYSNIFIQENAFENGVCERASILSRPQCVNINILWPSVAKWHHMVTWNCVNIGSGNLPEASDSTVSAVQWISQHSPIIMQTVIFIQILTINMP